MKFFSFGNVEKFVQVANSSSCDERGENILENMRNFELHKKIVLSSVSGEAKL